MTRAELNQICEEYQKVLGMSEEEVYAMYEESKTDCIASFEAEIDFWEKQSSEEESDWRTAGLDPAFSSWYDVNRMFV